MTAEELAKSITEWITDHAERESVFLYPNPRWNIDAHALLDHISEVAGIPTEQIEEWSKKEVNPNGS